MNPTLDEIPGKAARPEPDLPPPPEFEPATDAVKTIDPSVFINSGSAAFAPKMHPLTLTPKSSS